MLTDLELRTLNVIRKYPGISRKEIASMLKISKPVISETVSRLIQKGFVIENGLKKSEIVKPGRPRVKLEFAPTAYYCIGLELDERCLEAVMTDLNGYVMTSFRTDVPRDLDERKLVDWLCDSLNPLIEKIPENKILGLGIGVAAMVDSKKNVIRSFPGLGLKDVNLKEMVEKKLRIETQVINRVNADALAEQVMGAATGRRDVLLVFLDSGIGMGVLINDEVFEGAYGKAGELGWLITDWTNDRNFDVSSIGYLAHWISGHCLVDEFGSWESLEEIFGILNESSKESIRLKKGLEHLALAIANAILLFDPEIVVVKGRIGMKHFENIMNFILPVLKRVLPDEFGENINVVKGRVNEFSVARGAAFFVRKSVLRF